jgi:hypothetical protein
MGPESPVPGFFQLLAAVSEFGGGIGFTMLVAVSMHSMALHDPFVNHTGGRS